jgi:hypothetical protein
MVVVIVHSKATFVSGGFSFSPFGETGEGFDPEFPRNFSKNLNMDKDE